MELLEHFALGELEAFEALFRQFQGEVYGWILRLVRDSGVAEDLTVETFWRIYRARARFDPSRSFGPWARRIGTNVALDYLKTVRPEASLSENWSHGLRPRPPSSEISTTRSSVPCGSYRQHSGWWLPWRSLKKGHMKRLRTLSEPQWVL